MRILLCTPFLPPDNGGISFAVHHLAEGLTANGAEVCVAAPGPPSRKFAAASYHVHRFEPPRGTYRLHLEDRVFAWFIGKSAQAFRPQVLHAHNAIPTGSACIRICDSLNLPFFLTCHGEDIQYMPELGRGYRLIPRHARRIARTIARANGLIALSPDMANDYRRAGARDDKITVIPNGINCREFHNVTRLDARRRLAIDDRATVILAAGRNIPEKGFDFLLRALATPALNTNGMTVLLTGRGVTALHPAAHALHLRQDLRLCEHATPVGQRSLQASGTPSMEDAYAAADLLLLPSLVEGCSLVTLEAMAAGLPVVAFDSPGTRHLVAHNITGLRVASGDVNALADAIGALMATPDIRHRMGAAASEHARAFDRSLIARRHLDLYAAHLTA